MGKFLRKDESLDEMFLLEQMLSNFNGDIIRLHYQAIIVGDAWLHVNSTIHFSCSIQI